MISRIKILNILIGSIVANLLISLATEKAHAEEQKSLEILPLQRQYRFEETTQQKKDYLSYESYGFALRSDVYRLQLNYAKYREETGNQSLNIETSSKDLMLSLGYQVYSLKPNAANDIKLNFMISAILGTGQKEISTTLLSVTSIQSSDLYSIYGLGASAIAYRGYGLFEIETQALASPSFSPSVVFSTIVKMGFRLLL